ncbi:CMRF35-like molecule 9 isoform X2 [Oryzias latipes]
MIFLSNCFLILVGLTGVCYCSITTVKETSVKPGESISIPCLYESKYEKHVKYLCKGFYWATCSDVVKTNKPDTSGKFSVQDDKEQKTFTLNINHVESTDSDYWCVVEIDGGADVGEYFRLSVSGTLTSVTLMPVTMNVTNVTQPSVKERMDPTVFFISLGLLIFIVLVALFVLFVLKCKKTKKEPATEKTEVGVVYSDVTFKKKKTSEGIAAESDGNVTYSSVVSFKQQDRRVKQK